MRAVLDVVCITTPVDLRRPAHRHCAGAGFESLTVDANDLPRPFGEFTLLRLIAQGGMGAVFLALRPVESEESQMRHLPEGQEEVCVVKTVRSDLRSDREAVGRFLDEARVVQKLTHPRIARTLDAGVIDQTYFLAMEFISGRNLRDLHTRAQKLGQTMPDALIVHVVSEMLEALDYAHKLKDPANNKPMNIVHRDVSPHNAMLGFDGNTRLIDFGLAAHELKRELTRPGVMVGKLRYNAPEQVRDRALDGRSDIYAAAVVLYEFIANERFYEGLPEEQVWRVAMKGDHRPRSWRDIDIEWRHLLDVALQNEPEKRYKDAREFRMALLDVAEAKGVDLAGMRKESRRFMAELFGKEQVQEREMILQATGVAEARTRLFRSPSDMQSAIANIPAQKKVQDVVEMRTEILDTNAAHMMDLRDMMSHLASPNAVTQLPAEPIDSQVDSQVDSEDMSVQSQDGFLDGPGSPSAAALSASSAMVSGSRRAADPAETMVAEVDGLSESLSESFDDQRRYSRAGVEDEPQLTVQARGRVGRKPSNESPLEDAAADLAGAGPPPEPNPQTNSLSRRSGRRSDPLPPLPPLPAKRQGSSGGPIAGLIVGLLVVASIGAAAAIFAAPRLLKPTAPIVAPTQPLDPIVVDGAPPPSPPAPAPVVDVPPPPPAPTVEVPPPPPPEPVVEPPPPPPIVQALPPPPPTTPVKRKSSKPPSSVPSTLQGQVGYLRQYCVGRVQCAQGLVQDAANFAKLTGPELRDLKDALPRCIEKCQRQ